MYIVVKDPYHVFKQGDEISNLSNEADDHPHFCNGLELVDPAEKRRLRCYNGKLYVINPDGDMDTVHGRSF